MALRTVLAAAPVATRVIDEVLDLSSGERGEPQPAEGREEVPVEGIAPLPGLVLTGSWVGVPDSPEGA